jgi:hypothetical protein
VSPVDDLSHCPVGLPFHTAAEDRPSRLGNVPRVPAAYFRYPDIFGDLITFCAADDVWLAPASGGRAWRLTNDSGPGPLSPLLPGRSPYCLDHHP